LVRYQKLKSKNKGKSIKNMFVLTYKNGSARPKVQTNLVLTKKNFRLNLVYLYKLGLIWSI